MIKELTKEQEEKLPVYRDKWIAIGHSTESPSLERTREIINNFQRLVLGTAETPVELYDDPKLVWAAICERVGQKIKYVSPFLDGSFSASTFSYYDFFLSEKLVKLEPELEAKYLAWQATSELGMIYPFEDKVYVSKKPSKIVMNERGQLHCENGKALEYPSGWGFYALNGVRVPEYLVMTDSEKLDIEFFKKEKNADVKAEFVRKYGVERMLDMGKKIDDYTKYDQEQNRWWWKSEYELWDMAVLFPGLDYQPYLKMLNQTTGIWHVEACSPACRTLSDALKERFGGEDLNIVAIA